MKNLNVGLLLLIILFLNSCAGSYELIQPNNVNYKSNDQQEGLKLEYKYDLLNKKYTKKETKRGIKLVAIKITNNTERDLIFGEDFNLVYGNGTGVDILEKNVIYLSLKQIPALHLLYFLLTPLRFSTSATNGNFTKENSTPIGYAIGPGLALGNMIVGSIANKKFREELLSNNLIGQTIKAGETKSGLIGIRTSSHDAIKIKFKE